MKDISPLDRILLLITGILAGYQVVAGISGKPTMVLVAYTVAFGVLLVAGLLMIIMGFSVLDAPLVVVISSLIPLGMSLGLVGEYLPPLREVYLAFTILGLGSILYTRYTSSRITKVLVLAIVHGISGLLIFLLPLILSLRGITPARFALVGLGGGLIGIGGLLLSFQRAGKPVLPRDTILSLLPGLLLLMTALFVIGFSGG
ncbi:MAG: hypothetical protein R6U57_04665 [Anaerolineales bacterium]